MSLRCVFAPMPTIISSDRIDDDCDTTSLIASMAVVIGLLSALNQQIHEMTAEDEFIMKLVIPILRRSICYQYHAQRRVSRQHQRWTSFTYELTNRQFRRYFRMKKEIFQKLCDRIEECVGAVEFKSEQYLDARLMSPPKRSNNIFHAHPKTTGGMICGEVKLAVTLRILGGGSYRVFAVQPDIEGVVGGEIDVRRNPDGTIARGGRPTVNDAQSTAIGKEWRDKHRDKIARRQHVRPQNNWFREQNRVLSK